MIGAEIDRIRKLVFNFKRIRIHPFSKINLEQDPDRHEQGIKGQKIKAGGKGDKRGTFGGRGTHKGRGTIMGAHWGRGTLVGDAWGKGDAKRGR